MDESSDPHSHIPYGEDGSGLYSDSSDGCRDAINSTEKVFLQSIRTILSKNAEKPPVFVMADYGTADGGTSMPLFYSAVTLIKDLCGGEQHVHVIYEDQSTNDFKSLFLRLNCLLPGSSKSFLKDFSNTYISAVGVSFYENCVPPESYHLGFAASCFHWLRKKPANLKNVIHHTLSTDSAELESLAKQAAEDWEEVLLKRAEELKRGGRFISRQFCVDENGNMAGKTKYAKCGMFQTFNEILNEMLTSGRITKDEFVNTNINSYYRTMQEYTAPFQPGSKVTKAGLHLVSIESEITRCPYHEKWMKERADSREHARFYINDFRVWSNHSIFAGLSEARPEDERRKIVDEFYQKYEDRIAANPDDHSLDIVHAVIVVEKN